MAGSTRGAQAKRGARRAALARAARGRRRGTARGASDRVAPVPAERFAARARARRRRSWRRVLAVVVGVAVLAGAAWVVLASSVLAVRTVEVTGTDVLPAEVVAEVADVELGLPMARLDTVAVRERVAALRRVAAVEVERRWPGTVAVTVREREPVAVLSRGGELAVVDRGAVAFAEVAEVPPGLTEVRVPDDARPGTVPAAVEVLVSLPADVAERVTMLTARSPDDISFALGDGRTVVWGGAERPERKGLVLTALLPTEASVYDVSAPDVPTTR